MQALNLIVYLGTGRAIGHVKVEHFIHLFKIKAYGHLVCAPRVFATYGYILAHVCTVFSVERGGLYISIKRAAEQPRLINAQIYTYLPKTPFANV